MNKACVLLNKCRIIKESSSVSDLISIRNSIKDIEVKLSNISSKNKSTSDLLQKSSKALNLAILNTTLSIKNWDK